MLKVDCTQNGCVVVCDECPYWTGFRFSREDAWRAGREHERLVHPSATQATAALAGYRRRAS